MEKIKKYIKPMIYFYTILFLCLIIITPFNYFNIISYKSVSLISFIVAILLFMMIGFMVALKSDKKGYINGLVIGVFNIILFVFLSLILVAHPKLNILIFFLIMIISSTIGGMFGINYKSKEK